MKTVQKKITIQIQYSARTYERLHQASLQTGLNTPDYLDKALRTYLDEKAVAFTDHTVCMYHTVAVELARLITSLARTEYVETALQNQFQKDGIE
jgi:hypothetical protein